MPFPSSVRDDALVLSHRRCCVCQLFIGRAVEVHHIVQEADGGENTLENAIVLCGRCHGEAGHYNVRHPLGSKYSPAELRRHRDAWWEWCQSHPPISLPGDPIAVSPGAVVVAAGKWDHRASIRVTNTWTNTVFDVWASL